jgi:hypothetical protein
LPLLASPDVQTILGVLRFTREPPSQTRLVELADGDRIALEVTTPASWRPSGVTVVMLHGLCGCHRSPYLVRLAARLERRGARAVRMNLRGCGSGAGLARGIYHSGRSEDVLRVLEELRREHPQGRLSLVGFSLGGNIALKLAGELGEAAGRLLERVIAVCPPVDLDLCQRRLHLPRNRIYERHFLRLLVRAARARHRYFPELGSVDLPRGISLRDFDDLYTAPHGGFRDAADYYQRASARPLLARIRVPCRILFAEDDPFIAAEAAEGIELAQCVEVVRTRSGGHLGFIGRDARGGYGAAGWGTLRWMDERVLEWLGLG